MTIKSVSVVKICSKNSKGLKDTIANLAKQYLAKFLGYFAGFNDKNR